MGLSIYEQQITASNNFDATPPPQAAVGASDIFQHPAAANGGEFVFPFSGPAAIRFIELGLGGQSSWSIVKRDKDGRDLPIASGTTETEFTQYDMDTTVLQGQSLRVTSAGASTAMYCRVGLEFLSA